MAETFTKLFSSIIDSSVWAESHTTVRVWIAMLAKCDKKGRVFAAIPGLAHAARVTVPECEHALTTFMEPDPYSRTPDNEGRRIETIAGGWRLLNHAYYRDLRNEEDRREYQAKWARDKAAAARASVENPPAASSSTKLDKTRPESTHADADADAEPEANTLPQNSYPDDFRAFWDAYPGLNKGSKKTAFAKWEARKLARYTQRLIDDVKDRAARHWMWQKDGGQFIPMVSTYINGSLWETDIVEAKPASVTMRNRVDTQHANMRAADRFAEDSE